MRYHDPTTGHDFDGEPLRISGPGMLSLSGYNGSSTLQTAVHHAPHSAAPERKPFKSRRSVLSERPHEALVPCQSCPTGWLRAWQAKQGFVSCETCRAKRRHRRTPAGMEATQPCATCTRFRLQPYEVAKGMARCRACRFGGPQ